MNEYAITFITNGVASENIVYATTAEQATAYYKSEGYEVIGCTKTASKPKPGQPAVVVPENWHEETPQEKASSASGFSQCVSISLRETHTTL